MDHNAPPELAALYEQYSQLVEAITAGTISHEDGLATLATMTAVAGDGSIWSIHTDGEYMRARPGHPPEHTDPQLFVPATAGNAPGNQHQWPSPPNQPAVQQPYQPPATRSLHETENRRSVTATIGSFLGGRGRTVAVGVVAAVLIAVFALRSCGGSPDTDDNSGSNGLPAAVTQPGPDPTLPETADIPQPAEPTVAAPTPPNAEAMTTIIEALSSGKPSSVQVVTRDELTLAELAETTALFAGFRHSGYKLTNSNASITAGGVTSTITVTGPDKPEASTGLRYTLRWEPKEPDSALPWLLRDAPSKQQQQ